MKNLSYAYTAGSSDELLPLLRNFFLQTEKVELEATVVDETKERDSYCGQANRRFSG